jgi:hypothetical protein
VRLNELKGKIPIIRSRLVSSLPDFGQELSNCSKIRSEELRVNDIKDSKHKSLMTILKICILPNQLRVADDRQEDKLLSIISPLADSPSQISVLKWLESQKNDNDRTTLAAILSKTDPEEFTKKKLSERSELEMVSMNNSFGFRLSLGNFQEAKTVHQVLIFILQEFNF